MNQLAIILDFGGQYSHLIARRVRECGVYCEVLPNTTPIDVLREKAPMGIILTGGPNSVYDPKAPVYTPELLDLSIPVLGICYGAQLLSFLSSQDCVSCAPTGEYGKVTLTVQDPHSKLLQGVDKTSVCWMSHKDYVAQLPDGFTATASTPGAPYAVIEHAEKKLYGVQFHPEVEHSEFGQKILNNFLKNIAGFSGDWNMEDYVEQTIVQLRDKIGNKSVLCALSGGVDSTVAAVMVQKAVGDQLTCIFVDHGLLRKDEGDQVEALCRDKFHMNFIRVNAQERFLNKLSGVTEPEEKRKIIGEEFIRIFEEESKKLGSVDFLVQGTIYPDIIESGTGGSALIKSHHNVGGLPDVVDFEEIVEPLRLLFKDEVRKAGLALGIDHDIVWRQPFPGPGLAVRVIGALTKERLDILREADAIFREEIKFAGLEKEINQYFAVLTNVQSVGVMGDFRTYGYTVALRAVTTSDFMTADFAKIPYPILEKASSRIVNEVQEINRIVYDITSKPPSTIEWE